VLVKDRGPAARPVRSFSPAPGGQGEKEGGTAMKRDHDRRNRISRHLPISARPHQSREKEKEEEKKRESRVSTLPISLKLLDCDNPVLPPRICPQRKGEKRKGHARSPIAPGGRVLMHDFTCVPSVVDLAAMEEKKKNSWCVETPSSTTRSGRLLSAPEGEKGGEKKKEFQRVAGAGTNVARRAAVHRHRPQVNLEYLSQSVLDQPGRQKLEQGGEKKEEGEARRGCGVSSRSRQAQSSGCAL